MQRMRLFHCIVRIYLQKRSTLSHVALLMSAKALVPFRVSKEILSKWTLRPHFYGRSLHVAIPMICANHLSIGSKTGATWWPYLTGLNANRHRWPLWQAVIAALYTIKDVRAWIWYILGGIMSLSRVSRPYEAESCRVLKSIGYIWLAQLRHCITWMPLTSNDYLLPPMSLMQPWHACSLHQAFSDKPWPPASVQSSHRRWEWHSWWKHHSSGRQPMLQSFISIQDLSFNGFHLHPAVGHPWWSMFHNWCAKSCSYLCTCLQVTMRWYMYMTEQRRSAQSCKGPRKVKGPTRRYYMK